MLVSLCAVVRIWAADTHSPETLPLGALAPDFKLAHSIVYEAMRKEVEGFKQSPFGAHNFNGVDIK